MSSVFSPNVFETMRTYQGRIRAYELHLKRLFRSWTLIYRTTSLADPLIESRFKNIEYTLKKYIEELGLSVSDVLNGICLDHDYKDQKKQVQLEQVVRVYLSSDLELEVKMSPLDQSYVNRSIELKSTSIRPVYPPAAKQSDRQAWFDACQQLKCDEILLCDPRGIPLESNNSNLWSLELLCTPEALKQSLMQQEPYPLKNTIWRTPPADGQILEGITRTLLIDILQSLGAQVHCQTFEPIAHSADFNSGNKSMIVQPQLCAYFLSSTLKSLSWVNKIDNQRQRHPPFLSELYSLIEKKLSQA